MSCHDISITQCHYVPDVGGTHCPYPRRDTFYRTPEGHLVPDSGGTTCTGRRKDTLSLMLEDSLV